MLLSVFSHKIDLTSGKKIICQKIVHSSQDTNLAHFCIPTLGQRTTKGQNTLQGLELAGVWETSNRTV